MNNEQKNYVVFLGVVLIVGGMVAIIAMLFIADYVQSLGKFVTNG